MANAAHPGQVLISDQARALLGDVEVRDLGEQRFDDLLIGERVYERGAGDEGSRFPPPETLERTPHNLPVQRTRFIGRVRELDGLSHSVAAGQLLTLLGPGGCGKTRLALQLAAGRARVRTFPDGIWFVSLAELRAGAGRRHARGRDRWRRGRASAARRTRGRGAGPPPRGPARAAGARQLRARRGRVRRGAHPAARRVPAPVRDRNEPPPAAARRRAAGRGPGAGARDRRRAGLAVGRGRAAARACGRAARGGRPSGRSTRRPGSAARSRAGRWRSSSPPRTSPRAGWKGSRPKSRRCSAASGG